MKYPLSMKKRTTTDSHGLNKVWFKISSITRIDTWSDSSIITKTSMLVWIVRHVIIPYLKNYDIKLPFHLSIKQMGKCLEIINSKLEQDRQLFVVSQTISNR